MTAYGEVVLEARGISKSFPGVKALDRVDLTLRAGRSTAILGENGAGKSTLMKILAGAQSQDSGKLIVEGRPVSFTNPRHALNHGIAMIYQELSLVPDLTIAENIFLGREPRRFGIVDRRRLRADATAADVEVNHLHIDTAYIERDLNVALPLDGRFGLHPALGALQADWNAKRLADVGRVVDDYVEQGAFPGYAENAADMLRVIRNHRRAAHDLSIADNTYETVEASFQLRNLMRNTKSTFEALQKLEAPTFEQIFKNEELRREFENLTRRLEVPSS